MSQLDLSSYLAGIVNDLDNDAEDVSGAFNATAAKINGNIQTDNIAAAQITSTHMAINSVGSDAIQAGAVTNVKIANGAVGLGKIGTNAVEDVNIADYSVTTQKIGLEAVDTDQLADGAVTTSKLDPAIGLSLAGLKVARGKKTFSIDYGLGTYSGSLQITYASDAIDGDPAFGSAPVIILGWGFPLSVSITAASDMALWIDSQTASYCVVKYSLTIVSSGADGTAQIHWFALGT